LLLQGAERLFVAGLAAVLCDMPGKLTVCGVQGFGVEQILGRGVGRSSAC